MVSTQIEIIGIIIGASESIRNRVGMKEGAEKIGLKKCYNVSFGLYVLIAVCLIFLLLTCSSDYCCAYQQIIVIT